MAKADPKPRSAASYLAWARFWARYIDLGLYGSMAALGVGLLFPRFGNGNQYLYLIVTLPPALMVDALVLRLFGSSIGKLLLGLRVQTFDGKRPTLHAFFSRNLYIWLAFALGIPIVGLFTLTSAYNHLRDKGTTSWDTDANTTVISTGSSAARTWFGALIYVGMTVGIYAASFALTQHPASPVAAAAQQP